MDRALQRLKEQLLGDTWELNWAVLEGKKATLEELEEALTTVPFASSKRVVVLREVLDFWKAWAQSQRERLIKAITAHPASTILVLHHIGRLTDREERRKRKTKSPGELLLEALQETDALVVDFTGSRKDLERWVKNRLKKEGIPPDQEVVDWLLDISQEKMALLEMELEKFVLWGKKGEDPESPPTLWDVSAMVYKGDPRLISHLQALMAERGVGYFYRIVSSSISRLVAVLQAIEEGTPAKEALAQVSRFPRERKALAQAIQRLSLQEAMELLDLAMETEIALKSGPLQPQRDLERLMIKIVGEQRRRAP